MNDISSRGATTIRPASVQGWAQHPAAAAALAGADTWFQRLLPTEAWRGVEHAPESAQEIPARLADAPAGVFVILAGNRPAQAAAWAAARRDALIAWVPVPAAAGDEAAALALLRDQAPGPVATLALGEAGAKNAAVLAASVLAARGDAAIGRALDEFRADQTATVLAAGLEGETHGPG